MKPKTILITLSTLFLLLFVVGCDNKKEEPHPTSINGTWKCIGFGDAKGKLIKEFVPKDCKDCYVLTFKDGKLHGQSYTCKLGPLEYRIDGNKFIYAHDYVNTDIGELYDGNDFREFLIFECDRFAIKQGKLFLFNSENENKCLLFNRIK